MGLHVDDRYGDSAESLHKGVALVVVSLEPSSAAQSHSCGGLSASYQQYEDCGRLAATVQRPARAAQTRP